MPKPISTPCIGVCQLDHRMVCVGCGRSNVEIMHWAQMTEQERLAIMERIKQGKTSGK